MSFNFAISSDSAVRNTRRLLTPWEIHDVKFKGAEIGRASCRERV